MNEVTNLYVHSGLKSSLIETSSDLPMVIYLFLRFLKWLFCVTFKPDQFKR